MNKWDRERVMAAYGMPDDHLARLPVEALEFARGMLTDHPSESLLPQLMVWTRDGRGGELALEVCVLAVGFNGDRDKHQALAALGAKVYGERRMPAAVCLLSEAWSIERHPDEKYCRPADAPDRREVISASALALGGKAFCARMEVARDAQNRLVPGRMSETTPAQANLLEWFYRGFFAPVGAKVGIDLIGGLRPDSN